MRRVWIPARDSKWIPPPSVGIRNSSRTTALTQPQLGLGHTTNRYHPTKVTLKDGKLAKGGACGAKHSLLFTTDGCAFGAGFNTAGQVGVGKVTSDPILNFSLIKGGLEGEEVISAAAGRDFTVACTSQGEVYTWGSPEYGQLGNGNEGKFLADGAAGRWSFQYRSEPGRVSASHFQKHGMENSEIALVACGANHIVVSDRDGRVYSWGFGGFGRLGLGDAKDHLSPEPVMTFFNMPQVYADSVPMFARRNQIKVRAEKISCGQTCTYVLVKEPLSYLYFWGISKKAGEATLKPVVVDSFNNLKPRIISAGASSTIVVTQDKTIATWGPSPTYGELAYGDDKPKSSTKVLEVEYARGIKVLDAVMSYAASIILVDTDDEQTNKVYQASPMINQDEIPIEGATASKKRGTAAVVAEDEDEEEAAPPAKKSKKKKN